MCISKPVEFFDGDSVSEKSQPSTRRVLAEWECLTNWPIRAEDWRPRDIQFQRVGSTIIVKTDLWRNVPPTPLDRTRNVRQIVGGTGDGRCTVVVVFIEVCNDLQIPLSCFNGDQFPVTRFRRFYFPESTIRPSPECPSTLPDHNPGPYHRSRRPVPQDHLSPRRLQKEINE